MPISATALLLVLATLVANIHWTVQTYQDAVEVLNSIPFDEIEEREGREEVGGDLFTDLWTGIEDAFRFLEERQVEEDLRRLKMMEISKRFPIRRHNFVRFGKRFQPTHNFVRFGRSSPVTGARGVSQNSQNEAVAKRGSFPFSSFPESDDNLNDPSSIYAVLDEASRELQAAQKAADNKGFLRISRAAENGNLETSGDELKKRGSSRFVRFGRSVPDLPEDVAEADGGFEVPDGSILAILKKKDYGTARIGRVPAVLFLHRPASDQANQPSLKVEQNYNKYPRYG